MSPTGTECAPNEPQYSRYPDKKRRSNRFVPNWRAMTLTTTMISLVNGTPFVSLDQYQTGLRFKNRFLTKAALPLRPWFSWLSKTYDIATRSDKVQYCLNPRQYKKKSGKDIFELLHSQMDSSQQNEFVNSTKTIFRSTLQKICGGAPFLQPKSKSFPKLFLPNAQHSVAVHD